MGRHLTLSSCLLMTFKVKIWVLKLITSESILSVSLARLLASVSLYMAATQEITLCKTGMKTFHSPPVENDFLHAGISLFVIDTSAAVLNL